MTTPDNTLRNCKHEGYISIISWKTADSFSDTGPSYKICGTHPLRLYWTDVRVSFLIYFCCASHTCPSLFIYFLVVETNYVTPPSTIKGLKCCTLPHNDYESNIRKKFMDDKQMGYILVIKSRPF